MHSTKKRANANIVSAIESSKIGVRNRNIFEKYAEYRVATGSYHDSILQRKMVDAKSTFLVVFSADRSKVASTHGDHTVKVFDIRTGRLLNSLKGHKRTAWCASFHPYLDNIIASGCLSGQIRVWDLHTEDCHLYEITNGNVVASLTFHPTDDILAAASNDNLFLLNWKSGDILYCFKTSSHQEYVRMVKFHPLGAWMLTGIMNKENRSRKPELSKVRTRRDRDGSTVHSYSSFTFDNRSSSRSTTSPSTNQTTARSDGTQEEQGREELNSNHSNSISARNVEAPSSSDSTRSDADLTRMQSATTRTPEFSDSSSETRSSSHSTSSSVARHSSQISDTATRSSQPEGPRVAIASVNRQGLVRMIENELHNRQSWVENSEHDVQDQPAPRPTDEQARASSSNSRGYPGFLAIIGDFRRTGGILVRNPNTEESTSSATYVGSVDAETHGRSLARSGSATEIRSQAANRAQPSDGSPSLSSDSPVSFGQSPRRSGSIRSNRGQPPNRDGSVVGPRGSRPGRLRSVTEPRGTYPSRSSLLVDRSSRPERTTQSIFRTDNVTIGDIEVSVVASPSGDQSLNDIHSTTSRTSFSVSSLDEDNRAYTTATARTPRHIHTAVVIGHRDVNESELSIRTAINRAIAGAFAGNGEGAVAANIINTTYRLQLWDLNDDDLPDLTEGTRNVIVPSCKLHNDGSLDISEDGSLLATFVPSPGGFPEQGQVCVFSLCKETFGHCLFKRSFGPNAISLSFSPFNGYILVGLAARRIHMSSETEQLMGQVFKLPEHGENFDNVTDDKITLSILHPKKFTNGTPVSVNTMKFHLSPEMGIFYGTNQGTVRHCRIGNPVYSKDTGFR